MVDALFEQSESWAHADDAASRLMSIARMAGFTEESFRACLSDADLQAKVVATKDRGASEFGVDSTPTFYLNGKIVPHVGWDQLEPALRKAGAR